MQLLQKHNKTCTLYSMKTKRLFLFAGYNAKGVIDDALVHYVNSLEKFGDIVLVMDSNCTEAELKKVQKQCVYTAATRHGEYDFGSYKRAYIWACENLKIADYDFVYMVNDSVYGPMFDMAPYFQKMESMNYDAFGLVQKRHDTRAHIQSWFIGMRPSVFLSDWYDEFMRSITKLQNKGAITRLYELGFTQMVAKHNLTWQTLYSVHNRGVYNKIKHLYRTGMPFMKKVAFDRHFGALGRQILYVLNQLSPELRDAILTSACDQYGEQHVKKLLTRNPIRTMFRHIRYGLYKFFIKGI